MSYSKLDIADLALAAIWYFRARLAGMGLIDPPRPLDNMGISGLVVEYIVAIDVTRVRFPADALSIFVRFPADALSIFVRFPADALPIFYPPSLPLPLSLSCARADAYTARARAPARTVRGESRPGPGAGASRKRQAHHTPSTPL